MIDPPEATKICYAVYIKFSMMRDAGIICTVYLNIFGKRLGLTRGPKT